MEERSFRILPTTVNDEVSGRVLPAVTVVIDGSLKESMDSMINANVGFKSYDQIMATVIINGLPTIIQEINEGLEKFYAERQNGIVMTENGEEK